MTQATAPPTPIEAAPGWYRDPRGEPLYRYWDGAGWTDHVVPAAGDGMRRPAVARPSTGRGRSLLWLPALVVLAAVLVALVLAEDSDRDLSDPLEQLELVQELGGTLPGVKIEEFEEGFVGHPGGLTVGADGNLWFSEQFDDRIGVFDLKTKKATEFDVPKGTRPHNAYTGPDGNIWFTGLTDNIGVFDVKTKKVTLFRKGISKGAEPHVIIADPTNRRFMWFTETNGSRISRFDRQTRKVAELDLAPRTLPHGIVPDPGGKAIWWAEQGPDGLGRLDLSKGPIGSQAAFDRNYGKFRGLPKGAGPHDPLFGPDGNIYLTLQDSNEFGRFDPRSGKFDHFSVGLPPFPGREITENRGAQSIEQAADPDSLRSFYTLAVGPDRRSIFFNASIENAIGRFDLDTEQVFLLKKGISPLGGPLFVVQGPDKAIWFTEVGLESNLPGRLGRLTVK